MACVYSLATATKFDTHRHYRTLFTHPFFFFFLTPLNNSIFKGTDEQFAGKGWGE
jgi:hypothetical protein